MSDVANSFVEGNSPMKEPDQSPGPARGSWKPVLTLLFLSPAIGELLSGSSPPLQFFNPVALALLVALYGCGALLIREAVARRSLNSNGLLMLGAAYGIIEEGLTCKSFFNPNWTDTGFLSIYGRAWGVNWVWAVGLTVYHMVVSIMVPIFLTEALFSSSAAGPWLRRRGLRIAAAALALVTVLGFWGFDNRQFHITEIKQPLVLARKWTRADGPLAQFASEQMAAKNRETLRKAVISDNDSPDLRHALQDELNRLLSRTDLYSPERFAGVHLDELLKSQAASPPHGDKLLAFNRGLLEAAFLPAVATRAVYPFHPPWWWTLACLAAISGLMLAATRETSVKATPKPLRRPWLTGLGLTGVFVVVGFVLPGLVEHGAPVPAWIDCTLWAGTAFWIARVLARIDPSPDRLWRRGLLAVGVITPWILFAFVLGIFVGMTGSKSFSGMVAVAFLFGFGILALALRWRRRLMGTAVHPVSAGQI